MHLNISSSGGVSPPRGHQSGEFDDFKDRQNLSNTSDSEGAQHNAEVPSSIVGEVDLLLDDIDNISVGSDEARELSEELERYLGT